MKHGLTLACMLLIATPYGLGQKPPVQLRSFGNSNRDARPGFAPTQSRLSVLAGQLSLQLQSAREEIARAGLNPGQQAALSQTGDRAARAVDEFYRLTLQTGDLNRLANAHRPVDATLEQFAQTATKVAPGNAAVAQAINRIRYADGRVHSALVGDNSGADVERQAVVRLVRRLAEQADDLQVAVTTVGGQRVPPNLVRSLRSFANQTRRLSRVVDDGHGLAVARREYAGLATLWSSTARDLHTVAAVNASVRLRATRVNNLMQELARHLQPDPDWLPPPPDYGIIPRDNVFLVVAAGERGGPHVRVFHDPHGGPSSDFFAYEPTYKGGVHVAVADLNGDGFPDIVTAPGPDHVPLVRVFSGRDLGLLAEFVAYDPPFSLGVNVAASDLTRDGRALVAVGPGKGGPAHVKVFDLVAGKQIDDFFAHPKQLPCGARVALGDLTGDGLPDLVTAPAGGTGPYVQIWNGRNRERIGDFNAFDARWTGGVHLAIGSTAGGRRAEILVGSGEGDPPLVRIFDPSNGRLIREFPPFDPAARGGVRVAALDANGDRVDDIACAPGPGPATAVRVFDGRTRRPISEFIPFVNFEGGSYVAGHR